MKRLSFISFLLLFSFITNAQFFQYAEGPVFPDPGPGFAKILQMKDGSTMFIHISFTKGLDVQAYGLQYKEKTETIILPAYGTLHSGNVEGIFEINGDAVVMISDAADNETVLYRLIIDGKTAKLKEEKQIASVKKITGTSLPKLAVRKDPNSENYAVATFNSFESDTSKRIVISLYGNDNKEISSSFYSSKTEKYKYLQYIDMVVLGSDKVAMLLYGYNIKSSNEKTGELIFATLDKATKSVIINELDLSNDLLPENGITRYDPQTKRILLLMTAKLKSESDKVNAYMAIVDPVTRKLLTSNIIGPGEKVNAKYAEISGKKTGYAGMPQSLLLNNDGSYTIVYEEMETGKENDTARHTILRNTVVATYNTEAAILTSYLIPLDHYLSNTSIPPFYQSARDAAGQQFSGNNQFKSSTYISDGHTSFVVFNDNNGNAETAMSGKVDKFDEVKDADGFYCSLAGNEIIPGRGYVFGKPVPVSGQVQHKAGLFTVYDYDRANNIFIVLKQDKDSLHPGVKLVWLQP